MSEASLLPFNATQLEKLLEASMQRASDLPIPIDRIGCADSCPQALLPWLAWALSVDVWDAAWPEATKRQVITESVSVHRAKGTRSAIVRVLNGLDIRAHIEEWFEYGGDPHTFRLTAWVAEQSDVAESPRLSAQLYDNVMRSVDTAKPVRSHYDFRVAVASDNALSLATQASLSSYVRTPMTPRIHSDIAATAGLVATMRAVVYRRVDR